MRPFYKAFARTHGIKIVHARTEFGRDSRMGIHLLNPTDREIEAALERAVSQQFDVIYTHRSASGIVNNKTHV